MRRKRMLRDAKKRKRKRMKVEYSKIEPWSDHLAFYNGKLFMTKEDLKLFPNVVTLIPISRTMEKRIDMCRV